MSSAAVVIGASRVKTDLSVWDCSGEENSLSYSQMDMVVPNTAGSSVGCCI